MEKLLKELRKKSMDEKLLMFKSLVEYKNSLKIKEMIKSKIQNKEITCEKAIEILSATLYHEFELLTELEYLDCGKLTHELENIGKTHNDDKYNSLLIFFLQNHSDDTVKEGAIYGLSYHMDNEIVYHRMKEALNDEFLSPLIKEIIRETIQTEDEIRNGK